MGETDKMMNAQHLKNISEKLDTAVGLLQEIHQAIGPPTSPDTLTGIGGEFIAVPGMQAPWVLQFPKWDGKSEIYDEEVLKDFLGFNPNDDDPDGKSWCAGFLKRILEECGIDTTGLDLSALSFANFGYEVEPSATGDYPDGVFMVFQPKPGSKYRISHVGVKVDGDKLFGGNQGDSAKKSNLAWYLANAILVAVRCPNGYKLSGNTKKN